jgi:8-oxo-dGTP pyrophosphatase MutT (NUDIX family)
MGFLSEETTAFTDFRLNVEVVICFIEYNRKVLVLKKAKEEGGSFLWGVPGGKVDPAIDPDPEAALLREVKEETGVLLEPAGCKLYAKRYARFQPWDYRLYIYHTKISNKPPIRLSHEHTASKWIPIKYFTKLKLLKGQSEAFSTVYTPKSVGS